MIKNIFIAFTLTALLLSCKTQSTTSQGDSTPKVQATDQSSDEEKMKMLKQLYSDAYDTNNYDIRVSKLTEGSHKAEKWGFQQLKNQFEIGLFFADTGNPDTANKLVSYANKYHAGDNDPAYKVLMQAIIANWRRTPVGDQASEYMGGKEIMVDTLIQNMSRRTFDSKAKKYIPKKVEDYINSTFAYAIGNPQNKKSPEVLLSGAEMARINGKYAKALQMYNIALDNFRRYEGLDRVYLLKGFLLDNHMNDKKGAASVYRELIEKFPTSQRADDARFLLSSLDKSQEELQEMIKNAPINNK